MERLKDSSGGKGDEPIIKILRHHVKMLRWNMNTLPDLSTESIKNEATKHCESLAKREYASDPLTLQKSIDAEIQLAQALFSGKYRAIPDFRNFFGGLIAKRNEDGICESCVHYRKDTKVVFLSNFALVLITRCNRDV